MCSWQHLTLHAYTGMALGRLAAPVTIATVSNNAVRRLSGADRFATAVAVSYCGVSTAGTAGAVVLARSDDYPGRLVGTVLGGGKSGAVAVCRWRRRCSPPTQAEIVRVLPAGRTVYLLGGTNAIPASVADNTDRSWLRGGTLCRCGPIRHGTGRRWRIGRTRARCMLATGINFPDALAAGTAAANVGGVVLLTAGTALPPSVSAYLTAHPGAVYAIGGPAVIADPPRHRGCREPTGYGTAAAVATKFFTSPTSIGIASGTAFADALAGGALLGAQERTTAPVGPQCPCHLQQRLPHGEQGDGYQQLHLRRFECDFQHRTDSGDRSSRLSSEAEAPLVI